MSRLTRVVMGLAVGLATSTADSGPLREPLAATALDPVRPGEIQTGSVCSGSWLRCHAHVHVTAAGSPTLFALPNGWGPADLQSAYNINPAITTTPTIAIVDAYGYPTLEQDLATYRSTFGLPACTSASGCLKIVNQQGQAAPLPNAPPANDDWTVETALDIDMASAACPMCKILVVQAQDDQSDGLFIANTIPATLGAAVVSNSWGGPEQPGASLDAYEADFNHPGVAVFVSSGDNGYNDGGQGPDYPATSAYVIAVGGTNLQKVTGGRGWAETAWGSGGSACSLSITKPAYQTNTGCTYKATTDIAAVGDPQTGVAVYNKGQWLVVGGTSASAPLVAAIFAATGNGAQTSGSFIMQNAAKLNDVTSGSNGTCTASPLLCTAGPGWDGPTGYGTPNAQMLVAGTGPGSGSGSDPGGGSGSDPGGDPGGGPPEQDVTGGCAVGGSGAGLVLALGALVIRRRRR